MNRRVSVIIPTYQRAATLHGAVRTALAQREVEVEVVVVDDGSTDGTADAVAALDDRRIRYLRHHENRGLCATRNTGLAAATSTWVAFLDDDDAWVPGKLARQLDALAAVPDARWCVASAVVADDDLVPVLVQHAPPAGEVAACLRRTNCVPGGGSGVVADREAVAGLGGFDERLRHLGDWELWLRLAAGGPPAVVTEPQLVYRRHRGGMSADVDGIAVEVRELAHRGVVDADAPAAAAPAAGRGSTAAGAGTARLLGRALLRRQGAEAVAAAEEVVTEVRAVLGG